MVGCFLFVGTLRWRLSDGEELSLRHGVRCVADSSASVEDVFAVAEQIGAENIVLASRMNKAVVIFFKRVNFVAQIIANGFWIKEVFVQVNPLSCELACTRKRAKMSRRVRLIHRLARSRRVSPTETPVKVQVGQVSIAGMRLKR